MFNDGLLYEDKNWQYVSQGDRRFYTEVKEGPLALRKSGGSVILIAISEEDRIKIRGMKHLRT